MPEYHDIDLSERLFFLNIFGYWEGIFNLSSEDDIFPKDLVYLSKKSSRHTVTNTLSCGRRTESKIRFGIPNS